MAELEDRLQVQSDADLMNPCKHQPGSPTNSKTPTKNFEPSPLPGLTILRLPPLQLPLRLEGGDDVLDQVAVGVAIAIVRQPRVARETFLLLLVEEVKPDGSTPGIIHRFEGGTDRCVLYIHVNDSETLRKGL